MPEVVQRWRVTYRRGHGAAALAQRAEQEAWEAAVLASGLPATGAEAGRPRLGFAIPLPIGLAAEAERLDVSLTARLTTSAVRDALGAVVPVEHAIVGLHDVWVGEPSLASRVAAADYRIFLASGPQAAEDGGSSLAARVPGDGPAPRALAAACRGLLAAAALPRVRRKGERDVAYDLRPFLLSLDAADDAHGDQVRMRLRADQVIGVGRPDEVVAALGDALGEPLVLVAGVRERLWLDDELAP